MKHLIVKMQSGLTIFFEGGAWKLQPEIQFKIKKYASILKDIPELLYFLQGFLFNNLNNSIETFFISYVIIWGIVSLGYPWSFCIFMILIFMSYFFFDHFTALHEITKEDPAFKMGFILFYTVHRIYTYLYWKKVFLAIFLLLFIYLAFPNFIFAITLPLLISSNLVHTETLYNRMRIM